MKLHVTDKGDPSVGIFDKSWEVECPLTKRCDSDDLDFFREKIVAIYSEFAFGRVTATYDFEIDQNVKQSLEANQESSEELS